MVTAREVRKTIVERAITNGTIRYIFAREKKIDAFVKRHYTLRGALNIHSHALGWDLIRVPINIIWSVFNIVLALVAFMAKVSRLRRLHEFIQRIPPGLETDMDKEISWLLITELLELPHKDGSRRSDKDALMEEVMKDPDLRRPHAASTRLPLRLPGDDAGELRWDRRDRDRTKGSRLHFAEPH